MQRNLTGLSLVGNDNDGFTEMEMVTPLDPRSDDSPSSSICNDESIRAIIYTTCYNVLDG
jgi:hypothetical protein